MEQLPKIAQQRLQATAKAGVHPDPDLLTAFAEKSLNERERAQVLQHLGQCTDCRNVVSLAMPEIVAPSTIRAGSPWLTWPVLRWGALAACALVVSAAVTLHYERRQSVAPMVAEKAPAPAPSPTVALESKVSNQPAQKLAANIAPPSPFQPDRAFETAGKLAKQHEETYAKSASSRSSINGFTAGQLGDRRPENNPLGNERKRSDELRDNRVAKADAGNSLAGVSSIVTAPSTPPAMIAGVRPQTKAWNDSLDSAVRASNEVVTVEAESPQVETAQASAGKAKDKSDKKAEKAATARPKELPLVARNIDDLRALNKVIPSWTLSPDGALQRSFDAGKTWQTIPVASRVVFRALAANDSDIWVGGAAGALFHSVDAGQLWTQVKPVADGKPLTANIISVEFTDAQHGKLITDSHETWITDDRGASWHRN